MLIGGNSNNSASGAANSTAPVVDLGAPSYDEDVAEDRRKRILTK